MFLPVDASVRHGDLPFSSGSDSEVHAAIAAHGLGFTVQEARDLARLLGRDPTVLEAHLFNTMWSEHCSYKSSKPLLKKYLPTESPFVILGPSEDAGVVEIGTHQGVRYAAVLGHESHNHPSQIVPYEGAATGIGGIVRDVYCMGADVFAVLDSLRFGDLDGPHGERCREILSGVVDGIAGYGNPLGVPNLGGETVFHPGYDDNCLVNVIAAGVMPADRLIHSRVPGAAKKEPYDLVLVGKGTDASGFGGAAMASKILDSEEDQRSAVQVPDPFLKRVLRNASLAVAELAHERGIDVGFKDLGAGGIACVASEMADSGGVGVEVRLDDVHVLEEGLPPEVIACSETQERFGWAVPRSFVPEVLRIYNEMYELGRVSRGARASVIGRFLPEDPVMRVLHQGQVVAEAATSDITAGVVAKRTAAPPRGSASARPVEFQGDLRELALRVLSSVNVASKRELFSHYDQEVRGGTYFRPGEADAGVACPIPGSTIGVALSVDGNPWIGERDAYTGGAHAVLEAVRNVVATGARPRALTDCLNFGNPEKPEVFRDLVDAVRGMADAARAIGTLELDDGVALPFISGNVSLYNESSTGRGVPPSPIVCCLGVLPDVSKAIGLRLSSPGNRIVFAGTFGGELGASEVSRILQQSERGDLPRMDLACERPLARTVLDLAESRSVFAAHDVSTGGIFVAAAEMMLGARGRVDLGLELDLGALSQGTRPTNAAASRAPSRTESTPPPPLDDLALLFSESGGYLLEVEGEGPLPEPLHKIPHTVLGRVTSEKRLSIQGSNGSWEWKAPELESSWEGSFAKAIE
jgi:phosphoribosylformylglycinamidine synthase